MIKTRETVLSKLSKLPWRYDPEWAPGLYSILASDGTRPATVNGRRNALTILQSVNSRDALLAAAKAAETTLGVLLTDRDLPFVRETLDQLRAAISAAERKGED